MPEGEPPIPGTHGERDPDSRPSPDRTEDSTPALPARIDRFGGEYRFLSNFYPSRVIDEGGREHPTVEHAYQCSKATTDDDRERIAAAKHPSKAKRLGQRLTPDASWAARKDEVMRRLLVQKFAPGTELAARLTATSPAELVEGNVWGDTYWGICNGVGENRLGRMLMEIRERLINGHATPEATSLSDIAAACVPSRPLTVTLDGPSGTGKTTLADALVQRVGGRALHTGLHYRAVAYAMLEAGVALSEHAAAAFLDSRRLELDDSGTLHIDGRSWPSSTLETAAIDNAVSDVANLDSVRDRLIVLQKGWVLRTTFAGYAVVIEGRDAGTRIAPDADVRVFLRASAEERANRRHNQRTEGLDAARTLDDLNRRDRADVGHGRTTADTPGITVVDVDGIGPAQVLERLWTLVSKACRTDRR